MEGVVIRPASTEDIEALCRLYGEFHEFHVRIVPDRLRSLEGSGNNSELISSLKKIMGSDESAIFVAEVEGKTTGLAEVYLREDKANPAVVSHRYGHLQSLLVTDDLRKQGTGKKLVDAAETWAKEKGATEMRLDIWEFPEGPLRFYEKLGYRTLRRTLLRKL